MKHLDNLTGLLRISLLCEKILLGMRECFYPWTEIELSSSWGVEEGKKLKSSQAEQRYVHHHPTDRVATGETVAPFVLEYSPSWKTTQEKVASCMGQINNRQHGGVPTPDWIDSTVFLVCNRRHAASVKVASGYSNLFWLTEVIQVIRSYSGYPKLFKLFELIFLHLPFVEFT